MTRRQEIDSTDDARIGRTHEWAGSMHICSVDPAGSKCGETWYARRRDPHEVASTLLEHIGDWYTVLKFLPADYQLPPGVKDAIDNAHNIVADWTDLLARHANRPGPPDSPTPPRQHPTRGRGRGTPTAA